MSINHRTFEEPIEVRLHTGEIWTYGSIDDAIDNIDACVLSHRRQDGRFRFDVKSDDAADARPAKFGACELRDGLGFLISDRSIEQAIARWLKRNCPTGRIAKRRKAYRRPDGGHPCRQKEPMSGWRKSRGSTQRRRIVPFNRAYEAFLRDDDLKDVLVRVKLRARLIFDPWDAYFERYRSDWVSKCWKSHRPTQYRWIGKAMCDGGDVCRCGLFASGIKTGR